MDLYHTPKPFFRPKKNRWYVQLDGKHINLGPDEAEALRRYHELMAQHGKKEPPRPRVAGVLVVTVLDAYLEWLAKRVQEGTKARRTYKWYLTYLQDFARFKNADFAVASLTIDRLQPIHVYQWVDSHPGWKTGKRGAITSVQRAFNWARRAGMLKSIGGNSPVAAIEKPAQGRREQLVTEAEFRQVLAVIDYPEARDLVELSWETGMRPHELFICEGRFLEPQHNRLVFPVRLSKGKKVQRVVYLNDRAAAIVRRALERYPTGPLLRNADGQPWTCSAVNGLFQRIRRRLGRQRLRALGLVPAKIKRLTAAQRQDEAVRAEHERKVLQRRKQIDQLAWEHGTRYSLYAFRHAYCTEALEKGIDAVTVSVLMGHRDTTMISRVYSHVAQRHEHMQQAANRARGA